jgi:hypothetical protein
LSGRREAEKKVATAKNANYEGGARLIIHHNVALFPSVSSHSSLEMEREEGAFCTTPHKRWSGDPYQQHPFEMNKFPPLRSGFRQHLSLRDFALGSPLGSLRKVHFSVSYELHNSE